MHETHKYYVLLCASFSRCDERLKIAVRAPILEKAVDLGKQQRARLVTRKDSVW
jgi:hypothetical protein